MIAIEEEYCEAQVYGDYLTKDKKTVFLIKVSITDIGLYINGITAQASDKFPGKGLWVQLPRYNSKGKWYRPIETRGDSPLWLLIERLATQATEQYTEDKQIFGEDEYGKPIDLPDISF